jgi:hypothetical protein
MALLALLFRLMETVVRILRLSESPAGPERGKPGTDVNPVSEDHGKVIPADPGDPPRLARKEDEMTEAFEPRRGRMKGGTLDPRAPEKEPVEV